MRHRAPLRAQTPLLHYEAGHTPHLGALPGDCWCGGCRAVTSHRLLEHSWECQRKTYQKCILEKRVCEFIPKSSEGGGPPKVRFGTDGHFYVDEPCESYPVTPYSDCKVCKAWLKECDAACTICPSPSKSE